MGLVNSTNGEGHSFENTISFEVCSCMLMLKVKVTLSVLCIVL